MTATSAAAFVSDQRNLGVGTLSEVFPSTTLFPVLFPEAPDPGAFQFLGDARGTEEDPWTVFIATRIQVPASFDANIFFGADDRLQIWLDGNPLVRCVHQEACRGRQRVLAVSLGKGPHSIVLGLTNIAGPAGFQFRFEPVGDLPAQGSRFRENLKDFFRKSSLVTLLRIAERIESFPDVTGTFFLSLPPFLESGIHDPVSIVASFGEHFSRSDPGDFSPEVYRFLELADGIGFLAELRTMLTTEIAHRMPGQTRRNELLGRTWYEGRFREAEARAVVESILSPGLPFPWMIRCWCRCLKYDVGNALEAQWLVDRDVKTALRLHPDDPDLIFFAGRWGRLTRSRESWIPERTGTSTFQVPGGGLLELREAFRRAPGSTLIPGWLADVESDIGTPKAARDAFDAGIRNDREHLSFWLRRSIR